MKQGLNNALMISYSLFGIIKTFFLLYFYLVLANHVQRI